MGDKKRGLFGPESPSRQVFGPKPSVATEQVDKHDDTAKSSTKNNTLPTTTWEEQEQKIDIPALELTYQKEIEAEACRPNTDSGETGNIESTDESVSQMGGEDDTPTREVLLTTTITEPPPETDTLTVQMNTPEPTEEDRDNTCHERGQFCPRCLTPVEDPAWHHIPN